MNLLFRIFWQLMGCEMQRKISIMFSKNFMYRFDLMAKLLYLRYPDCQWYRDLYKNHILTFNGGWEFPGIYFFKLTHGLQRLHCPLCRKMGADVRMLEQGEHCQILRGEGRGWVCGYVFVTGPTGIGRVSLFFLFMC